MPRALRQYQQEAIEFGLTAGGRWVLADPPGAGKTATVSSWLKYAGAGRFPGGFSVALRTLLVVPLQVREHWKAELAAWHPHVRVVDGTGTSVKRAKARGELAGGLPGPAVLLLNYEALRQDIDTLVKMPWDTLVADEAHRLKGRSTVQARAAAKIARRCDFLCLITGTPVMNRAEELWSYLALLKPAEYTSFWRWARLHFEIETPQYGFSLRPVLKVGKMLDGHEELIRDEVRGLLLQRDESMLDLPPTVETVLPVELSPAERKAYDQLIKKSWLQLGEGDDAVVIQAPNVVARQTRARQLTSDWGSIEPTLQVGAKVKATHSLVRDLLEAGERVVVLTAYREPARRLAALLGDLAALYIGGMAAPERADAIARFRAGSARVFVGTIGAVGEGTDGLQVASHIVLLDRDWTPARNEQAVARVRRSGQTAGVVNVYHVVAGGTVDEIVAKALVEKTDVIEALGLASL